MLLPGQWIEVLPFARIQDTLDAAGARDGLPFMPEMLKYCGRRFRVRIRAERTCVHPTEGRLRRLEHAVALEGLSCDGAAHGGCQLGCALFWNESWLRRVDGPGRPRRTARTVRRAKGLRVVSPDDRSRYVCQATELRRATRPGEPLWSPWQYLRMIAVGTLSPLELASMLSRISRRVLRRAVRALVGARPGPEDRDLVGDVLGLRPGEWVEVRCEAEIRSTLDSTGRHRGLPFGGDMSGECGRRRRVLRRVDRIIDEATGRIRTIRDTVLLEGSICDRYLGCARRMPILWREAWLKRATAADEPARKGAGVLRIADG